MDLNEIASSIKKEYIDGVPVLVLLQVEIDMSKNITAVGTGSGTTVAAETIENSIIANNMVKNEHNSVITEIDQFIGDTDDEKEKAQLSELKKNAESGTSPSLAKDVLLSFAKRAAGMGLTGLAMWIGLHAGLPADLIPTILGFGQK